MQRNIVRNLLFVGIVFLLIGASFEAAHLINAHADAQSRIVLNSQTAPLIQHAQRLQSADPQQHLNLSIGLRLRNESSADSFLQAVNDPQSPLYHHYLTPEQFTQQFAPTPNQIQQVESYLQGQGITVTGVATNQMLIDATANVEQVQNSFQVHIHNYQLDNHTFYANDTPPSVPANVGQLITSISGLDDSVQYHAQDSSTRASSHTALSPVGLGPANLESAYDISPLELSNIQGQNQSIALFELDGYQQSDITAYWQNYLTGSTPTITNHLVDSFSGAAGSDAVETTLDIEMIGSIAPQSNILVYEGPNTTQGVNDTYAKIVNDDQAKIVSISWGLCEASSGTAELQTLDNIFKQGALEGISFLAGSGDAGAYDCQDTNLAVDSPADDPNVTGVGATTLQLSSDIYISEAVWSNAKNKLHGPEGAGSGGGLSTYFKQASWQTGTGVSNQYSNGYREVPDVTAFGDNIVGYSVYCTVTSAGCPTTGWIKVGGTSVAAPFWAASLLLINQYLQTSTSNAYTLGLANPALYTLFNASQTYPAFHDITSGTNLYYPATTGYDMASGMGSPDVYNIALDVTAAA